MHLRRPFFGTVKYPTIHFHARKYILQTFRSVDVVVLVWFYWSDWWIFIQKPTRHSRILGPSLDWTPPPPTVDGMQHQASPLLFLLCSPKQSLPPFHLPRLLFITRETMRLEEAGAHFNQILPPPPPFCQLAPCRRSNHKNCVMDAGWGLLLPKEEGIKSRTQDDRWVGEEEISSEEMKCRVDWSVSQSHSSLRFGGGGASEAYRGMMVAIRAYQGAAPSLPAELLRAPSRGGWERSNWEIWLFLTDCKCDRWRESRDNWRWRCFHAIFLPSLTSSSSASSYRLTESIKKTSAVRFGLSWENGKNKYVTELKKISTLAPWWLAEGETKAQFLFLFGLIEVSILPSSFRLHI